MEDREFQLIVFGATGFTGQFVALEVAKNSTKKSISWGVSGRSKQKLKKILAQTEKETGLDLNDVGLICADVNDDQSLESMCRRTKIILNCVGPYRFYGEQVVKACIKAKTNYVDVSGEPEFLETMQLRYHKEAEEAGIHIVSACGFDCVPADCGIEYLRKEFKGDLSAVESYMKYHGGRIKANFGTYESMVHGFSSSGKLVKIRKELMPNKLNYLGPNLKKRGTIFHSEEENQWSIPFMGADPSTVRRTQYYQQCKYGDTPIQYRAYCCLNGFIQLVGFILFGLILSMLSPFRCGRWLLKQFPKCFTLGTFSHDGLTREEMSARSFSIIFYGRGYSSSADRTGVPDKALGLKISGPEPGYVATPIFIVQAALTILSDDLPNVGGVLTPGSAFKDTTLMERLKNSGIRISTFELDI